MEKYAKGFKWVRCLCGCVASVFIGAEGKVKLAGKKGREDGRGKRRKRESRKGEESFLREKTPTAIFLKFYKKFLHDKIFKR